MPKFQGLLLLPVCLLAVLVPVSRTLPSTAHATGPNNGLGRTPAGDVQPLFQNVELLGQIGGSAYTVVLRGERAYVGFGPKLIVLDVSEPASPVKVGEYYSFGEVYDLALAGDYAYIADRGVRLIIVDISDPAAMTTAGLYDGVGYAFGVAVVGGSSLSASGTREEEPSQETYAYVADGLAGLRIIDVSDPASPTEVGSCHGLGDARGVVVVHEPPAGKAQAVSMTLSDEGSPPSSSTAAGERYAYVAAGYGGLRIVDVSNPSQPQQVGSIGFPAEAWDLAVVGSLAYVAARGSGVRIVDVSVPSNPVEVGVFDTGGAARDIAVVETSQIGDIGAVREGSQLFAYIADGDGGLRIVDVSDPSEPAEVGSYEVSTVAGAIAAAVYPDSQGIYAFVADRGTGLYILDVSDPSLPTEAAFWDTIGDARNVAWSEGDSIYIAGGYIGLRIIDISDPTQPVEAGFYDTPGCVLGLTVEGQYAYIADGSRGLRVADISDPAAPFEVGSSDGPGIASGVAVAGPYAYVASGDAGLLIVDASNPYALALIGTYDTPGSAQAVEVMDDIAFIADGEAGLRIVDVSEPSAPAGVGFYDTAGIALDVAVAGDPESLGYSRALYAYVADGEAGLRILDVSVPSAPTELGFCDTPGTAQGVALTRFDAKLLEEAEYAYVADAWSGVRVVDVSDPGTPIMVGFYDAPGTATGVAVGEAFMQPAAAPGVMSSEPPRRLIYLSGGDGGLRILRFEDGPMPFAFSADTPDGRVGEWHSFTTGFRDPNGWQDIARVQMVLGTGLNDTQGLTVMYRPVENGMYLKNAMGPGWLGPCAPGDPVELINGVVELDCLSSAVGNDGGQELQVIWRARWLPDVGEATELDAHLRAADQLRHDSGFDVYGSWTLLPRSG